MVNTIVITGLPGSGLRCMSQILQAGGIYPVKAQKKSPIKALQHGGDAACGDRFSVVPLGQIKNLPHKHEYSIIFMTRSPLAISQKNSFQNGEMSEKQKEILDIYQYLVSRNIDFIIVDLAGLVFEPNFWLEQLEYFLDDRLDPGDAKVVINPDLIHYGKEEEYV